MRFDFDSEYADEKDLRQDDDSEWRSWNMDDPEPRSHDDFWDEGEQSFPTTEVSGSRFGPNGRKWVGDRLRVRDELSEGEDGSHKVMSKESWSS